MINFELTHKPPPVRRRGQMCVKRVCQGIQVISSIWKKNTTQQKEKRWDGNKQLSRLILGKGCNVQPCTRYAAVPMVADINGHGDRNKPTRRATLH